MPAAWATNVAETMGADQGVWSRCGGVNLTVFAGQRLNTKWVFPSLEKAYEKRISG